MKKIILNMIMLLLRRATTLSFVFLSMCCCYSCATQNNIKIMQGDPIIGEWKLVRTGLGRSGSITHSTVDVILEFKPDNILTVQCLRQDKKCGLWNSGNYSYLYIGSASGANLRIGNTNWWYLFFENELMIGHGPVDGANYYFERI